MTTGGGQPIDDVDALERRVEACLEELGRAQYLHRDDARAFLAEIAYRGVAGAGRSTSVVEAAVESRHLVWPRELGEDERRRAVTELLTGRGIVADGDEHRFVDQAVQDYLAACHIVRRCPGGPRWWRVRDRGHLKPRANWPWPDAGVAVYLPLLWWRDAEAVVVRRLRQLLHERHRDPNIHFVVELLRRELLPSDQIRSQTVDTLRHEIADGEQPDTRWSAMVAALHRLDPAVAADELENIVRSPRPTMSSSRRFTAVREITRHDPARGARTLRILADNPTGEPRDRFDTAVLIREVDADVGTRAMSLLVRLPDMGELRVSAALAVGSAALWRELVEGERSLSDQGRSQLLDALLGAEPEAAVAAGEAFARTTKAVRTRVRIADTLRHHDRHAALRIANDVAWPPAGQEGDSRVRLEAVELLGRIDPAGAVAWLDRLSKDPKASSEVRYTAATRVLQQTGAITALVDFAHATADRKYRAKAAEKIGIVDTTAGARAFIAVAKDCGPADRSQLTLLEKAYRLDKEPAVEALVAVTESKRTAGQIRLGAVEVALPALSRSRIISLFTAIATSSDPDAAMTAARKVLAMDTGAGRQLMGRLAERPGASRSYRLTAAELAGRYGRQVLATLANTGPDHARIRPATLLRPYDERRSTEVLKKLAKKRGNDRIAAALALPGREMDSALAKIGDDDGERDGIRFNAVLAIKDKKRREQALRTLAESRRISTGVRDRIRRQIRD